MHASTLALLVGALLVPSAWAVPAAAPVPRAFICEAAAPSPELKAQMKVWHDESKGAGNDTGAIDRRESTSNGQAITVDTYFHVVSSTANKNLVTDQQLQNQMVIMNGAYASMRINFKLISIDYTVNDDWATQTASLPMSQKLHKGTYSSLNIYFHTDLGSGVLGTCSLPSPNPGAPGTEFYVEDGCNIAAQSVPGGAIYGYNLGKTAVHETGHWFGLLHPFEGLSCTGDGDFIADTPQESVATDGCPTNKDSCPNVAGLDPIHNYMDYSQDSCYTQFTPDQKIRMFQMYAEYRNGKP